MTPISAGRVVVDEVKGVGWAIFELGRFDSHEYGRVAAVSQETPAGQEMPKTFTIACG
jgi:hypothetical protein